jgi:alkanesulfonate monooxygenase SsuD/methylene tetrahydromethanopterin reductase-like flavin-dependent oxidoreductase (luciferase family)
MMKYYAGWFKTGGDLPGDEKLWEFENARDVRNSPVADAWMVGTPDQVAPKVEAFVKSGDFSHMVMVMQVPGVDTAKGTRSMELFAKEILPAFR